MINVKNFILNLYNFNGSFKFSESNEIHNLFTTCFGIMSLDLIREIQSIDITKTIKFLQDFQNPDTGLFSDSSICPEKKTNHNEDYIQHQQTDFAQLALSVLNVKPKYQYQFLNKYKSLTYIDNWFFKLNWADPWLVSNKIMFILNFFIYEDEKANKIYIDHIIKLLIKTQNKSNGYWSLDNAVSFHNQMAGAYHFLFYFTYLKIEPKYINRIIDSTLSIQDHDGLFNYFGGGGSCDDLDAIDILCRSTFYTNYKYDGILKALSKSYNSLKQNQNTDGGYCWAKRHNLDIKKLLFSIDLNLLRKTSRKDFILNFQSKLLNQASIILKRNQMWKYSNIKKMEIPINHSDIWSTWFRLLAIATIEKTFPEICNFKFTHNWKMRKKCGLGYYR